MLRTFVGAKYQRPSCIYQSMAMQNGQTKVNNEQIRERAAVRYHFINLKSIAPLMLSCHSILQTFLIPRLFGLMTSAHGRICKNISFLSGMELLLFAFQQSMISANPRRRSGSQTRSHFCVIQIPF
jgi:hypothetical protein